MIQKQLGSRSEAHYPSSQDMDRFKAAIEDSDPVHARILKSIVEMGNSVMYKKAASELHVLKAKHTGSFANVLLFRKALMILESHHYRLQARQFVLDLFDKSVLRRIVFESDTEDDMESESE